MHWSWIVSHYELIIMTSITQILVYIKRARGNIYPATFQECLFEQLGLNGKEINRSMVNCYLQNNKLILQNSLEAALQDAEDSASKDTDFTLCHPPFCPVLNMSETDRDSLPKEISQRGVNVGVAVLLESSDQSVLLTRRAHHMRTFPGVWVPPGGHIELDETLEMAGIRELTEETGLFVTPTVKKNSHILGLWESVYPPILVHGLPLRHHVVVYIHILSSKASEQLDKELKLNPEEVDSCIWLPKKIVQSIATGSDLPVEEQLKFTSVDKNGDHCNDILDPSILLEKMPPPGADTERISTGTRYALELWLRGRPGVNYMKNSHL